jgi:prolyl oligopeptidase
MPTISTLKMTLALCAFVTLQTLATAQVLPTKMKYPETRRDETVIDDYHGIKVADPYRWLEDDRSEETKAWVKSQNEVTFGYLNAIPFRAAIKSRLEKIWNYEKYGAPFKEGGKYFFFLNTGLQNQAVMYMQDNLTAAPVAFLNPNELSTDGTVALGSTRFNKVGDKMAYQLAKAGSDWQTIYVKDVKSGKTLEDKLDWVKFSGMSWQGDGFYYSRYPTPEAGKELTKKSEFHQVWFHKAGTAQSKDVLVYENKEQPNYNHGIGVSEDERFTFLSVSESTSGNELYFKDAKNAAKGFQPLAKGFVSEYDVIDNTGDDLMMITNDSASNRKIVLVNSNTPEKAAWKTLIAESKTDVMQSAEILGGKLVVTYLHDAASLVKIYDLKGNFIQNLPLPDVGTVGGFSGKREDNQAFYSFSSFARPNTIYELDMTTLKSKVFKAPKVDFNSDAYETKQVFYASADGTKVPMFITHKKGLVLDGNNPTLLYGYGGFNISITPSFALSKTVLLENGGVYVVANIRGGGEYGEAWHKAGTKDKKQNVFNDFIAAAEYLIDNKYTSSKKLAIEGGSNGGLLVGACMTQRPDLFQVAFPRVGVLDMLRYDKFTIGRAWSVDYGLSENKDEFKYLYNYSPLHRINNFPYPATMVTTGDHDDRVVPAHSFKFAANLQFKNISANPTLIRIETSAGHGAGKPTSKIIEEAADIQAFMFYNMGVKL